MEGMAEKVHIVYIHSTRNIDKNPFPACVFTHLIFSHLCI